MPGDEDAVITWLFLILDSGAGVKLINFASGTLFWLAGNKKIILTASVLSLYYSLFSQCSMPGRNGFTYPLYTAMVIFFFKWCAFLFTLNSFG